MLIFLLILLALEHRLLCARELKKNVTGFYSGADILVGEAYF